MEVVQTLGKYEIRGTLGRGAMGIVYDGWDPRIERRVAIKAVRLPEHPDPDTEDEIARFRREAQAAGRLTHPNIVGVYDYGETSDLAYIVMEFVDGTTLKALLDKQERFAVAEIRRIMHDLLTGLQYSHDSGVVHRDIKPANIMLTSTRQAKIADFGIARIESSSMTQAGTVLGTPAYMSPEQFMGQVVDERTDIYSSGVLLYQLLTGERPFDGSMTAIMHKVLNTEPPPPSQIAVTAPLGMDAVVRCAMAKRPEDRYRSAAAFIEAIVTALAAPVVPVKSAAVESEVVESEATMVAAPRKPAALRPPASAAAVARPSPIQAQARSARPLTGMIAASVLGVAVIAGGGWWFVLRPTPPMVVASSSTGATAPHAPDPGESAAAQPAGTPPTNPTTHTTRLEPAPVASAPQAAPPPVAAPPSVAASPSAIVPPTSTRTPFARLPVTASQSVIASQSAIPSPAAPASPSVIASPPATPSPAAPASQSATAPPVLTTPPLVASPPHAPASSSVGPALRAGNSLPVATLGTPLLPPALRPPDHPSQGPQPKLPTSPAPEQVAASGLGPIRHQLEQALAAARCALVNGAVQDSGTVTVTGLAGRTADDSLRREIVDLAGPRAVDWRVQRIDPVFCDALAAVHPINPMAGASDEGLRLSLLGGRAVLHDGDPIMPRVTMPGFAGLMRVDYLAHDGSVAHLYPSVADPAQHSVAVPARILRPGETLEIGEHGGGRPQWDVGPPYGTDMIIAVASSVALLDHAPPNVEDNAADYLRRLQMAIETARRKGASVTGTVMLVDTLPKVP